MSKNNITTTITNITKFLIACLTTVIILFSLNSCNGNGKNKTGSDTFVINEIMSFNQTGLTSKDGNIYDWIEIKNVSENDASLEGYSLTVEKFDKKENRNKKDSWTIPNVNVKAGGFVIVFASKNVKGNSPELHADFKLPSEGGKIMLTYDGLMIKELEFPQVEADECYRRLANGKYEKSYEATPGFENNRDGFEKYNSFIDSQRKGPLRIWETHAKGYKTGNAWVEVKNISDKDVQLSEYYLATSSKNMKKWQFPDAILKAGERYVVDTRRDAFKIGKYKPVILTKNGKFEDGVCASAAPYGVSVGRVDGKRGFFFFPNPTRGEENNSSHFRFIANKPIFKPQAGVYPDTTKLKILIESEGMTVHYTTDGSKPTENSPVYKDSIIIDSSATIRAFCKGDSNFMNSATVTQTFLMGDKHSLPVFNITVANADLYDHGRGIYVPGPEGGGEYPHKGANYWKPWWKKAHVELFDGDNGFSEDCELAIFGGFSRTLAKKSFKLRFKDFIDKPYVEYDFFNNGNVMKLSKFILRSGSQDIGGVMVRDEFFTSLMAPTCPNLLIQPYRPCVLYINGDYFGVYYIREKIDKNFVARRLKVSSDSISIIMSGMYCEEGTKADFSALLAYANSHDLTVKENYEYVKSKIDLEGLIDFKLGLIYSNNVDVGNVRFVKSEDSRGDRKWHIVYYDLDLTWNGNNSPAFFLSTSGANLPPNVNTHNGLIMKLLKNQEFRQLFLQRLSLHMHKTFSEKNATAVFDNIIETIKPEMERNCKRWEKVMSYEKWENNVKAFREKFKERPKIVLDNLRKHLEITDDEEKKYFADLGF